MMGRTHAESGLAAAVVTAAYLRVDVPTFVLLCTTLPGSAILNDIDHPDSTVSSTYGPITGVLCKFLDHRKQTHSVPGIVLFGSLVTYASLHSEHMIAKAVLFVVLVLIWSSTLRLFKIKGWLDDFAPIPFAGMITFGEPWLNMIGIPDFPFKILGPIVVLGMLVHVAGDVITHQPIPIMWPFSKRGTALKLFKAGSRIEYWIMQPMIFLATLIGTWHWIKQIAMIKWEWMIF